MDSAQARTWVAVMEPPNSSAHALCQRSIASSNRPLYSGPCHLRGTQPNSARSHRQRRPPQSPRGVSGGPSHRTSTPSRFLKWRMPSTYSNFGYRCPAGVAPCRWAAFGGGFAELLGFRLLPSEESDVVDESSDQPESEEPESDESECRGRPFRARLALAFSRRRFFFSFSRTFLLRSLRIAFAFASQRIHWAFLFDPWACALRLAPHVQCCGFRELVRGQQRKTVCRWAIASWTLSLRSP